MSERHFQYTQYQCVCGKIFDNPYKCNRHKQCCRAYIESINKDYEECLRLKNQREQKSGQRLKEASYQRSERIQKEKAQQLQQWISEQHRCEHCGKIMTERYGSGRFCCKSCANARQHSTETKQRVSRGLRYFQEQHAAEIYLVVGGRRVHKNTYQAYQQNPRRCIVCGTPLPYRCTSRTCSKECLHQHISEIARRRANENGGNINTKSYRACKQGTYDGIRFNSTYELAFYLYCKDHNIQIERCTLSFPYVYREKEHLYYPDFMVEGTCVEIKNFWTPLVQAKAEAVPSTIPYKILFYKDLKPILDYCYGRYGGKKFYLLFYEQVEK